MCYRRFQIYLFLISILIYRFALNRFQYVRFIQIWSVVCLVTRVASHWGSSLNNELRRTYNWISWEILLFVNSFAVVGGTSARNAGEIGSLPLRSKPRKCHIIVGILFPYMVMWLILLIWMICPFGHVVHIQLFRNDGSFWWKDTVNRKRNAAFTWHEDSKTPKRMSGKKHKRH